MRFTPFGREKLLSVGMTIYTNLLRVCLKFIQKFCYIEPVKIQQKKVVKIL